MKKKEIQRAYVEKAFSAVPKIMEGYFRDEQSMDPEKAREAGINFGEYLRILHKISERVDGNLSKKVK